MSQRSFRLSPFLLSPFCSAAVISTTLSSASCICSSTSFILLLVPSSVLFVLVILSVISVCCLGGPSDSDGKESACSAGDLGSVSGQKGVPEKGIGTRSIILAWRIRSSSSLLNIYCFFSVCLHSFSGVLESLQSFSEFFFLSMYVAYLYLTQLFFWHFILFLYL